MEHLIYSSKPIQQRLKSYIYIFMQNPNKQVQRSLDRLSFYFDNPATSLSELIPALFYSSDMLNKYAIKQFKSNNINHQYFRSFDEKMKKFILKDLSNIKVHQKQYVDEILQHVNSQLFIACLHPERKFFKKSSILRIVKQTQSISSQNQNNVKSNMIAQKFWQQQTNNLNKSLKSSTNLNDLKSSRVLLYSQNRGQAKLKKTVSQIKLDNAHQLYSQIKFVYEEHRIDKAHKLVQQFMMNKFPFVNNCQQLFDVIQQQYAIMIQMARQLDRPEWKHEKTKGNISVYSLVDKNDPLAGVKMQSQFQIPIQNIMAILCQIDLMKQYTPFCFESKLIKRPARNKVLGYSKISIPLLTNRQACLSAVGYDRIQQNGTIFMISRSIDSPAQIASIQQQHGVKFPKNQGFVNLKYKYFVIQYTPLSIDKARIRIASKVDMQINFAPMFVMKSSAITFGLDYFNNIKEINKSFSGSAWDYKMKQNPDLYNFFIQKISEYNIPQN